MTWAEKFFVATLKAVGCWFDVMTGDRPHLDPPRQRLWDGEPSSIDQP